MIDDRFVPDPGAWDPWTPAEIARRLAGIDLPWCVAAGYAIDLFLGRVTREHGDLEIAVPHDRAVELLPIFPECDFFAVDSGEAWLWHPENDDGSHQTWVRERSTGKWRFDLFREPHVDDTWICRRNPELRRPYRELIQRSADGIPFAAPEVVLFFKAKASRPKDEADFASVLPELSSQQRSWLIAALEATHPGHPWIARCETAVHIIRS